MGRRENDDVDLVKDTLVKRSPFLKFCADGKNIFLILIQNIL